MVGLLLAPLLLMLFGRRARGRGWRDAALDSATICAVVIVLLTELLSVFTALTQSALIVSWLIVDAAIFAYLWRALRPIIRRGDPRAWLANERRMVAELSSDTCVLLGGVAAVVVGVAITALIAPPNTTDALTYHLPRIVYWIQHQSVAFFQTSDLRQLHMPPWAEFAMLHVHLLYGGDRFDNVLHWGSFLGCVIGVTRIAQMLGADSRGQVLAAVLCVSIPQGILEASGAKNDYIVAFWLVALVYYLLAFKTAPTYANTGGIGGALGLAWLTKGTAYLFAPTIVLSAIVLWPWKAKLAFLKRLPIALAFALCLNVGHFARNFSLFGSPLGPGAESTTGDFKYTVDEITGSDVVANMLRNLALHLGTPSKTVTSRLEQGLSRVIESLGGDPNNPLTTWSGATFHVPEMSRHEALAGNPLHLVLIGGTLVLLVVLARCRTGKDLLPYIAGLVLAFVLFSAVLRWQPWHTRLHLPLFVLWSAALGTVVARAWSRWLTTGLGVLLLCGSIPFVLGNHLRPLAFGGELSMLTQDRRRLYFSDNPGLMVSHMSAVDHVSRSQCRDIGLDLPLNSPIYPMLALLEVDKNVRRVQYVNVENLSRRYAEDTSAFHPCLVLCFDCSTAMHKWRRHLSHVGPATVFDDVVLFEATTVASSSKTYPLEASSCSVSFLSGWYGEERGSHGWWRWMDGRAELQIHSERDLDLIMRGSIGSIQRPNDVYLTLNDRPVSTWAITWEGFNIFAPTALSVRAGDNRLLFVSDARPIRIPTDSRSLALAMSNLLVASADGTILCELGPAQ